MDPKRKPASKVRPSADPLRDSALFTIVAGLGDYEGEVSDRSQRPHRASSLPKRIPPSPTAEPSPPSGEPLGSGTSAAVGMAGEVISGVPEVVESSSVSLLPVSPELPAPLQDRETEVLVGASEPVQPPQLRVESLPPTEVCGTLSCQQRSAPPLSTDVVDQEDRDFRPPPTPKGVHTVAPALPPRAPPVVIRRNSRRPLSEWKRNLFIASGLLSVVILFVWELIIFIFSVRSSG